MLLSRGFRCPAAYAFRAAAMLEPKHAMPRTCRGAAVGAVTKGDFVVMDFKGKDESGTLVISSDAAGQDGYAYEIGDHMLIPDGLHNMVLGMSAGESKSEKVAAADAMGERDEEKIIQVPRDRLGWKDAKVGAVARVQTTDGGILVVQVTAMDDETITIDANNPLAGQAIDFDVTVKDITPKAAVAKLTMAGGCFWGPELAFQRVPGVLKTGVGYSNGQDPAPTYDAVCTGNTGHTEAVQIAYDAEKVSMDTIMDTLWNSMKDPFQVGGQGNDRGSQYRTGVYWHTEDQRDAAVAYLAAKEKELGRKPALEVEEVSNWHLAEDNHQQYLSREDGAVQPQSAAKGCTDEIRCYG